MNQSRVLCQISRVLPSEPRPAGPLPAPARFSLPPCALIVIAIVILAVAPGCSGGTPNGCPSEYPMSCPATAPSFAAEVGPLIQAHCAFCHGSGQQIPRLDTYDQISLAATKQKIFFQIQHCSMPPAPRPPLSAAERDTILSWLVCGAMNN